MKRMHIVATIVGIVVYLLIQCLQPMLNAAIMRLTLDENLIVQLWAVPLVTLSKTILVLLPGLVAGLLVLRHGIVAGFVVGTIGDLLATLMGLTSGQSSTDLYFSWFVAIPQAISAGMFCAVAGAAGQLVRSNKSLERTRGR